MIPQWLQTVPMVRKLASAANLAFRLGEAVQRLAEEPG
jgi:hypothetical protein